MGDQTFLQIIRLANIKPVTCFGIQNINEKDLHEKRLPFLEALVENIGFEPITSSLPAKRSSQMS